MNPTPALIQSGAHRRRLAEAWKLYEVIDWSKSNTQIARELLLSRPAVSRARKRRRL